MYATLLTLSVAALSVADSIGVGRKFYSNPTRKFPSRQPPPLIWSPIPRISECVYSFSKPRAAFLAATRGGTDAVRHHCSGNHCSCWRLCSYVGDGTDCPPLSQHHCSGLLLSATSSSVNSKHVFRSIGFL